MSSAASTCSAGGEVGSTLSQVFAASTASSGMRAKFATSMARRATRGSRVRLATST